MRRFESVGNLARDRNRLIDRRRPAGDPIGERLPLDQLEDQRVGLAAVLESVNRPDVRMVERSQHLRFALKRARRSGSAAKASGRIFSATSRLSFRSRARYTSPMPPAPSVRGDLVRAETGAGDEWHQLTGTKRFNSSVQFCTTMTPTPAVCWVDWSATSRSSGYRGLDTPRPCRRPQGREDHEGAEAVAGTTGQTAADYTSQDGSTPMMGARCRVVKTVRRGRAYLITGSPRVSR